MTQESETTPVGPGGGRDQSKTDRWGVWLAVAGGLGIVIGVVALIIAISANHSASDNQRSTKQLRAEATSVVAGVDARLRRDSATATALLKNVNRADGRAGRVHAQLRRDLKANAAAVKRNAAHIASNAAAVKSNTAGVSANKESIQGLQASVSNLSASLKGLNSTVQKLENQVANLRAGQRAVNRRITALGG